MQSPSPVRARATPGGLASSKRIRRTPYTERLISAGALRFTVVNHTLLAREFADTREQMYWHLNTGVQLWDVACQRQVEIDGPDAETLVQFMTPRDISVLDPGDCLYVPVIDENGGILNDPVLLKHPSGRFWLSGSDSDLVLYAKGIATGAGMSARINEPDIWPLAVQGPNAEELMVRIFGDGIVSLGFFRHREFSFRGARLTISRSGFSRQDGFEVYPTGTELGPELWDSLMNAGTDLDVRAGCPNLADRIEAGLLSYRNDMNHENSPLEVGFEKSCVLDGSIRFAGRDALRKLSENQNTRRRVAGVVFDGPPCPACSEGWNVYANDCNVGEITSGAWSPGLAMNVGISLLDPAYRSPGQYVDVDCADGMTRTGRACALPIRPRAGKPALRRTA